MATEPGTIRSNTQQRRDRIIALASGAQAASITQMATEFGVSESTIRRDLRVLADQGRLVRVLGGALSHRSELSWHEKERTHEAAKRQIARVAAASVPHGASVLLDAGSSAAAVAIELAHRSDLLIYTYGLNSLVVLADSAVDVVVLGGRMRRPNGALTGPLAHVSLQHIDVDVAFIGADALFPDRGISCPDLDMATLKTAVMGRAREAWVVADHSKLMAVTGFEFWSPLQANTGVIVDAPMSRRTQTDVLKRLEDLGHPVRLAE